MLCLVQGTDITIQKFRLFMLDMRTGEECGLTLHLLPEINRMHYD